MICSLCRHNDADHHFITKAESENKTIYLCRDCYEKNFSSLELGYHGAISDSLFNKRLLSAKTKRVCGACGLSIADFLRARKFGCDQCYRNFEDIAEYLLIKIHGKRNHKGKKPANSGTYNIEKELRILKAKLDEAILKEEFENAARFRDAIRALEHKFL